MRAGPLTIILLCLTVFVLAVSLPSAMRDAYDRGGLYLFSWAFLEDFPRRLTGPGKLRFVLQPLMAVLLGIRGGLADARMNRPPYLEGMLLHSGWRPHLMRSGLTTIANLVLLGVLLDAVFQWAILGVSHPGAAVVVGPVLITAPYAIARGLSNRLGR